LLPILLLVVEWLPIFRGPDLMADRPRLAAYWQSISKDSVCARLIEETRAALREQM
jgi:hypothetical protein